MRAISAASRSGWAWIFGVVLAVGAACTDAGAARETLAESGYTQIRTTGYSWFSCGEHDGTCTGFEAIGPTGRPVRGAVSCGYWSCSKACTVRIEAVR